MPTDPRLEILPLFHIRAISFGTETALVTGIFSRVPKNARAAGDARTRPERGGAAPGERACRGWGTKSSDQARRSDRPDKIPDGYRKNARAAGDARTGTERAGEAASE